MTTSLTELRKSLDHAVEHQDIELLYGPDPDKKQRRVERIAHLLNLFEEIYGDTSDIRLFSTPGRSEISGNHTDHQQGRVLVAAIDPDIICAVRPHDEPYIRFQSEGFARVDYINITDLEVRPEEEGRSAAMIRGVLRGLKDRGYEIGGFDAYSTSLVPAGSGLSSSAAFEVAVCGILNHLYNDGRVPPLEQAQICQFAENVFFGKPSGLLDQMGCAVGGFAYVDFRDPEHPEVEQIQAPFEDADIHLVLTGTGGSHSDLTHCYADIPAEMKQVAQFFDEEVLREVDPEDFYASLGALSKTLPSRAILRAMHFFDEDHRVSEQRIALLGRDIHTFLDLVNESGRSSQLLLQNIYNPEEPKDQPLSLALAVSEHILSRSEGAWRIHGGGFAGTIQAFVAGNTLEQYVAAMDAIFGEGSAQVMQIRPVGTWQLFKDES